MKWWYILVALLDVYLLASLGAWIVLQVLEWLLLGLRRDLPVQGRRLQNLAETETVQATCWPEAPRPGRYQEPDSQAAASLAALRDALAAARPLWASLEAYAPSSMGLLDALRLRVWGPLPRAWRAWREARALKRLLAHAEEAEAALRAQQQRVQEIPQQVRAEVNAQRAEVRRLQAILEAEQGAGTLGLEEIAQRLEALGRELEGALDSLASAQDLPCAVAQVDALLAQAMPAVAELDRTLSLATEERAKAQGQAQRVASALAVAEERWAGLKTLGATEPAISRTLAELRQRVAAVEKRTEERTLAAYRQVNSEVGELDQQLAALLAEMDTLETLMARSKEAVAGDVQALAQAQSACEALRSADPLLEPDQSLALIEQATAAYEEAERQRGLGSRQGYETAITLAQKAMARLAAAQEQATSLPQQARQVRDLLSALGNDALGDWRARTSRAREQLQRYARHWNEKLAGDAAEALASLEQVEIDLERVPPNVRYLRRLRQSELGEALEILAHGRECMERAKALVAGLEQERDRLEALRREVEAEARRLAEERLGAIQAQRERMLPELRQRLAALESEIGNQLALLGDPSQVDYDAVAQQWLPGALRQVEELERAQRESLQHYRALAQEVARDLERQWARLNKLNPQEPPVPEEDLTKLADDLQAWREAIEAQADNPLALRELIGRRATALEQRLENARQEIVEGRRRLEALYRVYNRHAQGVRSLREAIRAHRQEGQWPQLAWESAEEAEALWGRATELEQASRTSPTLALAGEQLQRACNTAQQAEDLLARIERQMAGGLQRLNQELAGVTKALERGRRRVAALREAGPSPELNMLEERLAEAQRALELARASTTFDDALRHLHTAVDILG